MDTPMQSRWMTLQEVAEYLQLSKDMIYRLAQNGRIPASKVGSRWRFRRERIDPLDGGHGRRHRHSWQQRKMSELSLRLHEEHSRPETADPIARQGSESPGAMGEYSNCQG